MKSFTKNSIVIFGKQSKRGFAATATVNIPKFELYKLDESKMPKTTTTNKQELMAYFTRMS